MVGGGYRTVQDLDPQFLSSHQTAPGKANSAVTRLETIEKWWEL